MGRALRNLRRGVGVREEKGGGAGAGLVLGIVFCQKGKCSSSRVKEGCRVEGRGTLQQLVSIIRLLSVQEYECFQVCVCVQG